MVPVGSRLIARWIIGAIVAALVFGATPLVAESKSEPAKVDPALLAAAKADPRGLFAVIVRGASTTRYHDGHDDNLARVKKAEDALSSASAEGQRRTLSIIGGASASLRGSRIISLAHSAAIERIVTDQRFSASWTGADAATAASEAGIVATNAPKAWSQFGVSGKGIGVAVLDSGVANHPDLGSRLVARVDVTDGESNGDPGGHGTHVAGLIAGDGTSSGGAWTGTAPQANIVSVRVIDSTGHATLSWVFSGMQWVLKNRSTYNIKIANLSFGATAMSSYQNDLLASAAEMLYFAGLTVVVAAGNAGPGPSTVTTPGTDPFVISVGASDDGGSPIVATETIAVWSSRGPTAYDGIAKPDLVAPGRRMISLRAAGSTLDTLYPDRRVTAPGATVAQYFQLSGTSMAVPVVAGIAALYLERNPDATPRRVKQQLTGTAFPLLGVAATDQGAGVVDAFAALNALPQPMSYTRYPASSAFATQIYSKVYGQPIVWRDPSFNGGVDQNGITWQNITWQNITWQNITWQNIVWEAFTWPNITWQDITWQNVTWQTAGTPTSDSGSWTLVD